MRTVAQADRAAIHARLTAATTPLDRHGTRRRTIHEFLSSDGCKRVDGRPSPTMTIRGMAVLICGDDVRRSSAALALLLRRAEQGVLQLHAELGVVEADAHFLALAVDDGPLLELERLVAEQQGDRAGVWLVGLHDADLEGVWPAIELRHGHVAAQGHVLAQQEPERRE